MVSAHTGDCATDVSENGPSMAVNLKPAARPGGTEPRRPEVAPSEGSNRHERIPRFGTKWQLSGHGLGAILALPESVAEPGFIGLE